MTQRGPPPCPAIAIAGRQSVALLNSSALAFCRIFEFLASGACRKWPGQSSCKSDTAPSLVVTSPARCALCSTGAELLVTDIALDGL